MLIIVKKTLGCFLVFDKSFPGSQIHLNFYPFLQKEKLTKGAILHLRARPPINPLGWTYGVYDIEKDDYFSVENLEIEETRSYSLNLPNLVTKPTHVLIYPDAFFEIKNDVGYLFKVHEPTPVVRAAAKSKNSLAKT